MSEESDIQKIKTLLKLEKQPCFFCKGNGATYTMKCCGIPLYSGECCGDGVREPEACQACDGTGLERTENNL